MLGTKLFIFSFALCGLAFSTEGRSAYKDDASFAEGSDAGSANNTPRDILNEFISVTEKGENETTKRILTTKSTTMSTSHSKDDAEAGQNTGTESSTTGTAMEDGQDEEDEICFQFVGCFSMNKTWKSPIRPIPAPLDPKDHPVKLLMFSRESPKDPYVIETYPHVDFKNAPFDPSKRTAFIVHGFSNNGTAEWMHDLKDAYLRKVDANFFISDWGPYAQQANYLQVAGNTRVVGRLIANVVKDLVKDYGADLKKIHLMGHSLGAQISSYVGKEVPGIARLTALDPAQPGFETYDKAVRLDKSDADFVDVIHTDAKPFIPTLGFGMMAPHGHVDFYVNGGFQQPGCIIPEKDKIPVVTGLLDLLKFPVDFWSEIKSCNHGRAHQYLIEAFNETGDCIFWGHKANAHNLAKSFTHTLTHGIFQGVVALSPNCNKDDCVPLGFATQESPLRGTFVVTTANRSPYCVAEILTDTDESGKKPNPTGTALQNAKNVVSNLSFKNFNACLGKQPKSQWNHFILMPEMSSSNLLESD